MRAVYLDEGRLPLGQRPQTAEAVGRGGWSGAWSPKRHRASSALLEFRIFHHAQGEVERRVVAALVAQLDAAPGHPARACLHSLHIHRRRHCGAGAGP